MLQCRRSFTGGSRELWFVDARAGDHEAAPRRFVLRLDTGAGAMTGTELTLRREASVYRALATTDVPIPALVGVSADGSAILLERVPGSSNLRHVDDHESRPVASSYLEALGTLHRVDVAALDLPAMARPATPEDHALLELALWRRVARPALVTPDPLVAFALAWLERNPPQSVQRTVLVQGDTGPGNFVVDAGRVTALVDWEFAHIGDPMDDIAWLDMRAAGSPVLGDATLRDRLYEAASGLTVDAASVAYYAVLVRLRCALTTTMTIARGGGALGLTAYLPPHHRFHVELAATLAAAIAPGDATSFDDAADLDATTVAAIDEAPELGALRESVANALDPAARLRARDRLVEAEHSMIVEREGARLDAAERRDLRTTFGSDIAGSELTRTAIESAAEADRDVLAYLARRARRRALPWATHAAGGTAIVDPVLVTRA